MTVEKLKPIIGSVFYAGFLPNAPGTWGSFLALVPVYVIYLFTPFYGIFLFALLCSWLTLWVSPACEYIWGDDPSPLVMDEWAGQSLTFFAIPFAGQFAYDLLILLSGFFLFRFFDIKKPLGIHKLQQFKGGWGVLADDLLAGFYAFLCLRMLILIINIL